MKPTAPPETRTKPVEAALATSLSPEQSDMSLASASVALPTAENHLFAANDAAPLGNVISNESVGNPIVAPTTAASFAANSSTPPEVPIQQEQFAASPQGSSTVAVVAASNQATSQVSPPASPQSQVSQPSASNHAQVVIAGVRPGRGIVHVAIFTEGKGFPNAQSAVRTASLASDTESVTTELSERGRVAIAVYQDINGDGTLNVNRFGIPTEPFAFSNNAMGNRGPPTFDDAAIDVGNTQLSPRPIRIQLP